MAQLGDSPEYQTIQELYPYLVTALSPIIDRLGDVLFGKSLIPHFLLEKIQNPTANPEEKVRQALNCLTTQVKCDASVYHRFVKALKAEAPLCPITQSVMKNIREKYKQIKSPISPQLVPLSELGDDYRCPGSADHLFTTPSPSPMSPPAAVGGTDIKRSPSRERSRSILTTESHKHKDVEIVEEWETRRGKYLKTTVQQVFSLVSEANQLADSLLDRDIEFKVVLALPSRFLSCRQRPNPWSKVDSEVRISVLDNQVGIESILSTQDLEKLLTTMKGLNKRVYAEDFSLGAFIHHDKQCLLGVASFSLECLRYHNVAHDYTAPLLSPSGEVCGSLRVVIEKVSASSVTDSGIDVDQDLLLGETISCQINVVEASGLPKEYCEYVFCRYKFWREATVKMDPPLMQSNLQELSEGCQRFDGTKEFVVDVTEDFLSFIETGGVLTVEVWDQMDTSRLPFPARGPGASREQSLSVADRLKERIQSLELWVEIKELNHHGEYVSVGKREKTDVSTGGVFKIRQGHAQRISVSVRSCNTVSATDSHLKCRRISSISIGGISLRSRDDGPLDSFHCHDLDRLWKKWSSVLSCYRDHLNDELEKANGKKKEKLLQKWYQLLSLRDEVFNCQTVTNELPGAPTNWSTEPGFEARVPVIFFDEQRPTVDSVSMGSAAPMVYEERDEAMIDLAITETQEKKEKVCAVASWDPTIHNAKSLNTATEEHSRVYAILKVSVALSHPPGAMLELQKRICLKVSNKRSWRSSSASEQACGCGIRYNVVVGDPRAEGIWPPPIILQNPSVMELMSGEDPVEKFKKAFSNVMNKLTISLLQQEVSLMKKVTETGKTFKTKRAVKSHGVHPHSQVYSPTSNGHARQEPSPISFVGLEPFGSSSTLGGLESDSDKGYGMAKRRRKASTVPIQSSIPSDKMASKSRTDKRSRHTTSNPTKGSGVPRPWK